MPRGNLPKVLENRQAEPALSELPHSQRGVAQSEWAVLPRDVKDTAPHG